MNDLRELKDRIFDIAGQDDFEAAALDVFRYQASACAPYARYLSLLGVDPTGVDGLKDIPFLPIEFFRNHEVYSAPGPPGAVFVSSGTSGTDTSRHIVYKTALYERSFNRGFEYFYGPAADYSIFALLPSYLEREGSSLAYMTERLHAANPSRGGFFLYDLDKLAGELRLAADKGERILLIGVTFALMDFAERFSLDMGDAVVMETGGMKGRRREVGRSELHSLLEERFGVLTVHSEYGMAELLSQAYSSGGGIFRTPPWMRVSVRDLQNPLRRIVGAGTGGLDIIDLANIYSCSFVSTGDRGTVRPDGSFEVHGRIENEMLRGCNMLV